MSEPSDVPRKPRKIRHQDEESSNGEGSQPVVVAADPLAKALNKATLMDTTKYPPPPSNTLNEATLMDTTESPLPPSNTSTKVFSYKDKLLGGTQTFTEEEDIIDEEEIEILEGDVSRLAKLNDLWKPSQPFQLMDIGNDYFLVTFRTQSYFLNAISDYPWTIFGNYLTVKPWSTDFSTAHLFPRKIIAWIRLLGLPVTLYKRNIIKKIGECIGRVVCIDYQTDSERRGRFAPMSISINLHKPLISKLLVNGNIQIVEYESLPKVCFSCGKFDHVQSNCPDSQSKGEAPPTLNRLGLNIKL
ncbi:uncharacterized protein LOC120144916 [Hibiscus syriacus]|uniref:uncharacterized protein LOC120144916 n=1 Tax=Hibiscus syriacus TaxID=106335 RepID=UPI0019215A33|nr:uncharacterized protein LOC120144916 [Hibiscus syriacus]